MDLGTMVRELGTGMLITTEIFVLTLVFSLPLGMVLAFGRMARLKVLSFLTKLYISIMRGTPLMYFVTLGWNNILTKTVKNEKVRSLIYRES